MKKTIWIINQYASTLETGIGGRHYYFARELAKKGYDVYLFSAGYHHLLKKAPQIESNFKIEKVDGFNYVWIKMPFYQNAHSKKRIFNEFLFSWKIRTLDKKFQAGMPDVIIYSSPALIPFIGANKLAKKVKAKLVLDVRDLWPLTLIEMGGYSPSHPVIKYFQYIENKAYKKSDHIISNWPYAIDYMVEHGALKEDFTWIPNGFSKEEFDASESLSQEFLSKIPEDKFLVGYTGTLGKANALGALLNAAEILRQQKNEDIYILIVGGGREKKELKQEIKRRGLCNIILLDAVSKKQVPSVLSLFDACYVGFLDIPLYRFGSSLTKLPEYFASAKPIIYASNSPFQPVKLAQAGLTVSAENASEIAKAMSDMSLATPKERKRLGDNGLEVALSEYEYSVLTDKLEEIIS